MLPTFFIHAFAQQVAAAAVTAAWQGSIIAAGSAVCLRIVPRTSRGGKRFTLWAAAFAIASLGLPLVTLGAAFVVSITSGVATTFAGRRGSLAAAVKP